MRNSNNTEVDNNEYNPSATDRASVNQRLMGLLEVYNRLSATEASLQALLERLGREEANLVDALELLLEEEHKEQKKPPAILAQAPSSQLGSNSRLRPALLVRGSGGEARKLLEDTLLRDDSDSSSDSEET